MTALRNHDRVTVFRYVPMEALALSVLFGLFAAAAAALPALRRRDTAVATRTAARVLLAGALLAVLTVTMMAGTSGTGVNLLPGSGIRTALNNANRELGLLNLVGNVVMFVPLGFLAPLAARFSLRAVAALCVSLSVSVELLQLTLGRSLDIDDVLLNTFGGVLGAAAGVAVAARLRTRFARWPSHTEPEDAR